MKGYRTVIVNILMLMASAGVIWGIEISPEQIDAIATGIVSIITVANLFLRKITTTKMGEKE